ncbi:replication protein [Achromobacter xylosoxidans]|uniref:replication protein n=1 Tax=Alcaligenes xylosoxydans xylosoxydans TaxID=85698 RepID=UPI0013F4C565|nr:replication protein [Achromobacter xylosoxidans]
MSAVILTMPTVVTPASPQVEDGYTRISNELLGALVLADLTKQQWEVLMAVVRKTYGFNKTEDDIALSQLATMTDGDRGNMSRAIASLVSRRILNRSRGRHGQLLSINKDYTQWGLRSGRVELVQSQWKGCAGSPAVVEPTTPAGPAVVTPTTPDGPDVVASTTLGGSPVVEATTSEGVECCKSNNAAVVEPTTTKDNSKRKLQKQKDKTLCAPQADRAESVDGARADQQGRAMTAPPSTRAGRNGRAVTVLSADDLKRFERFYAAYPRKRSRIDAEKAFAKLNPDDALLDELLAGIERAKTTEQWRDPTKIPYPASWLNAGAWEDEIETAYSSRELEVIESFNETLGDTMGLVDQAVYSERRAGAIRTFLTLSEKPSFWTRFFPWIRDNCTLPPYAGFEWLMKPETVTSLRGGQFTKEQGR